MVMKNIHLVPTDKPSNLFLGVKTNKLYIKPIGDIGIPQHIYITNDEEIKRGDYFLSLNEDESYLEVTLNDKVDDFNEYADEDWAENCKKIILTTDQDLIADGVQAIDDEFLEWFVKNPSCEKVETFIDTMGCSLESCDGNPCVNYKIIIPKQELDCPYDFTSRCTMGRCDCKPKQEKPCTQDVVDEAMKIVSKDVRQPKCVRDGLVKKAAAKYRLSTVNKMAIEEVAFEEGAKWQAERMHSEDYIIDLIQFLSMNQDFNSYSSVSKETAKRFFEQFKNR